MTLLLFNSKALLSQQKLCDAAVITSYVYQNLQRHRAVLPAIAWHLVYFRVVAIYEFCYNLQKMKLQGEWCIA